MPRPVVIALGGNALLRRGQALNAENQRENIRIAAAQLAEVHTSLEEKSQELWAMAHHDALTGLINRREFELRLERLLDTAQSDRLEHAVCYLDLDQFKVINDSCGHVAGDELLRQLGNCLLEKVRKVDTLARLGGDTAGHYTPSVSDLKAEPTASQSECTQFQACRLSRKRPGQLRRRENDRYCLPCLPHLSLKLSEKEI